MKERLYSLDVLRGLDMILLVIVGPVIKAADPVSNWLQRVLPASFLAKINPSQTVSGSSSAV